MYVFVAGSAPAAAVSRSSVAGRPPGPGAREGRTTGVTLCIGNWAAAQAVCNAGHERWGDQPMLQMLQRSSR
jgi:hypothetical protein